MNCYRVFFAFYATVLLVLKFLSFEKYCCTAAELGALDDALKNYDKRVRPLRDISPLDVKIQVSIFALGPISTKTFTFQADFFLRERWVDP